jgi:hypothetical protein
LSSFYATLHWPVLVGFCGELVIYFCCLLLFRFVVCVKNGVLLHVMMPVTWLHNLTKDDAVQLACRLGIHFTGTEDLDQFRKVLNEKLKDIQDIMPSEMFKEKDVKVTAREMDQASSGVGATGATSS